MEQPNDKDVTSLALQAGHILLENGAEIFRVEETMERICRYYGVDTWNAFVLSNGMFVSATCRGNGDGGEEQVFAQVRHIPVGSTHLYKVTEVNQLSREIADGKYTVQEAQEKLKEIQQMPGKRKRTQILASAVGSAAFCCMFGGSFTDVLSAFAAGWILYVFILFVAEKYLSKIVGTMFGAAIVTLLCGFLYLTGFGRHMNCMIIGAIMPMIPGVAFTTAIRDVTNGDYISGAVRMLDALLVFFCIAIGVGAGISLLGIWSGGGIL